MIRVFIADDHTLIRRGLQQILAETDDIVAAGEARTAAETLRAVREAPYDLVLLDIALPDQNGLEVLAQLHTWYPQLPVLILSMHPEQQYALRALKAGASGYLTKDNAPEELITAIRQVASGQQYLTPSMAKSLVTAIQTPDQAAPHQALSDREYEVLRLLGNGKAIGAIARELSLSPKTVSTYHHRLLKKLSLKSLADLVRYVIEHNIV